jgi:hypothetical protein
VFGDNARLGCLKKEKIKSLYMMLHRTHKRMAQAKRKA